MSLPKSVTDALPNLWAALNQPGSKPFYQSKTFYAALLLVAAGFYPPTAAVAVAYPGLAAAVVGGVFTFLRFVSHGKITAS